MTTPTDYASFFRTWWSSRFTDTCVVKRQSGETFNSTTGTYEVTYSTIHSGGCLVRPSQKDEAEAGEQHNELRNYFVFVPHTVTDLQADDLVDVTSGDGYLNGRQLVVRNVRGDTYNHARRLECEEVV